MVVACGKVLVTLSRRGFLKGSATAATIAALPPALAASEQTAPKEGSISGFRFQRTYSRIEVAGKNGIEVEFLLDGKWLKGIRAVSVHGKPLRNTSEYIWPEVSTPYGMEVCGLEFLEVRIENDGAESGAIVISSA